MRSTSTRNVVLVGPPGTGKTHLATGLGIAAAHHGHRVLFATATEWVTRLTDAHRAGRLPQELARLRRYQAVAAAMIDRVVHHADVLTLKGASYRLRIRGIDTLPNIRAQDPAD
jgi:DNA replication protein DnaC